MKKFKKVVAMCLTAAMALSMMSVGAFASADTTKMAESMAADAGYTVVENMIDYELKFNKDEPILLVITANAPKDSLVQIPLNIYNNSRSVNSTFTINGTSGNNGVFEHELLAKEKETKLRFEFNTQELEIKKIVVMQEK